MATLAAAELTDGKLERNRCPVLHYSSRQLQSAVLQLAAAFRWIAGTSYRRRHPLGG